MILREHETRVATGRAAVTGMTMTKTESTIWQPGPQHLAAANVTALGERLGVAGYDALYRLSIERPGTYWRAVNTFCRIAWSKPYEAYSDLSRGKEFPRWFVGGELNWTDTVFAWCDEPHGAERPAIIAESEDGSVARLSYAELKSRVGRFAAG